MRTVLRLVVALWIVGAIAISTSAAWGGPNDASESDANLVRRDRDCGAYAVAIVLRALGRNTPAFDDVRAAVVDDKGQSSLLDLRGYLERLDVPTTSTADVRAEGPPVGGLVIAKSIVSDYQRPEAHFIVIAGKGDGQVHVYSPPDVSRTMTWAALKDRIDGPALVWYPPDRARLDVAFGCMGAGLVILVLLVWRSRRRPRAGQVALLAFLLSAGCDQAPVVEQAPAHSQLYPLQGMPSNFIDVGYGSPGIRSVGFQVRNTGSVALTISDIPVSCGCFILTFDKAVPLAAGEARSVTATLRLQASERRTVIVRFLDTEKREIGVVSIAAEAGALTGVSAAEVLDLGPVRLGLATTASVPLTVEKAKFNAQLQPGRDMFARWRIIRGASVRLTDSGDRQLDWTKDVLILDAAIEVSPLRAGPDDGVLECLIAGFPVRVGVSWTARSVLQADVSIIVLKRRERALGGSVSLKTGGDSTAVAVLEVESSAALTAQVTRAGDGEWKVDLSANDEFARKGGFERIWIAAKDEQGQLIDRIPFRVTAEP